VKFYSEINAPYPYGAFISFIHEGCSGVGKSRLEQLTIYFRSKTR